MDDPDRRRKIAHRLVVWGELRLLTPAHLGNGDAEGLTDMPLLLDSRSGAPFLPGTSIAGALRSYLLAGERGFGVDERTRAGRREARESFAAPDTAAERLFGGVKGDPEGEQSPLIVDDAPGALPAGAALEVRDSVRINPRTRTAEDRKKYDLELLPAGTTFALRFELLARAEQLPELRHDLAAALTGLTAVEGPAPIRVGARKSRGFGACAVTHWRVQEYSLKDPEQLLAWLAAGHEGWHAQPPIAQGGLDLVAGAAGATVTGAPRQYMVRATFELASPLLIRSPEPLPGGGASQPDQTHLRSWSDGAMRPALPGTSVMGALRSHATRIVQTIVAGRPDRAEHAADLLDELFGNDMHRERDPDKEPAPTASRLRVNEALIDGGHPLVQQRVAIDRFTGGAFETALFAEAPHVGGKATLELSLRCSGVAPADERRERAMAGLLMLLLRDLWSGALTIGGTASVGRGRLRGLAATIAAPGDTSPTWELAATGLGPAGVRVARGDAEALNDLVTDLHQELVP